MATDSGSDEADDIPAKKRSPIEKLVVRGGIALLLSLVAVEYISRQAQTRAEKALQSKLEASEADSELPPLTESDVQEILGKTPASTEKLDVGWFPNGAVRADSYEWFSVNPFRKRELYVYYGIGKNPDVIEVREHAFEELGPYRPENWPRMEQAGSGADEPAGDAPLDQPPAEESSAENTDQGQ